MLSDNVKRAWWAAVTVLAAGLALTDPPPTWAIWPLLFFVAGMKWNKYATRVRRQEKGRGTWGS